MKFKELKSRVATLSLGTENNYRVEHYAGQTVIVHSLALYQINENTIGMFREANDIGIIPERDRLALQKLAYKYSRTPIDERRDEPKFRVRMMPNLPNQNSSLYYVNYSLKNSEIDVGPDVDMSEDPLFRSKCHFTKKEYVSIQREFPEWLPKFDKDDPHFEIVEDEK